MPGAAGAASRRGRRGRALALAVALAGGCGPHPDPGGARAPHARVHEERNGLVAVEAEHFAAQEADGVRRWYVFTPNGPPPDIPGDDAGHLAGASGGAYLRILPDTRRTHDDALEHGVNFSDVPGVLGVLHYRVRFRTPGRYYVWVRAHSTGSEDNSVHVGINGTWPESGQRLQWCEGKHGWRWESLQRTVEQHCGEPHRIYLDVPAPGVHTISFSMREDGFTFDRWLMTLQRDLPRPEGPGPEPAPRR